MPLRSGATWAILLHEPDRHTPPRRLFRPQAIVATILVGEAWRSCWRSPRPGSRTGWCCSAWCRWRCNGCRWGPLALLYLLRARWPGCRPATGMGGIWHVPGDVDPGGSWGGILLIEVADPLAEARPAFLLRWTGIAVVVGLLGLLAYQNYCAPGSWRCVPGNSNWKPCRRASARTSCSTRSTPAPRWSTPARTRPSASCWTSPTCSGPHCAARRRFRCRGTCAGEALPGHRGAAAGPAPRRALAAAAGAPGHRGPRALHPTAGRERGAPWHRAATRRRGPWTSTSASSAMPSRWWWRTTCPMPPRPPPGTRSAWPPRRRVDALTNGAAGSNRAWSRVATSRELVVPIAERGGPPQTTTR